MKTELRAAQGKKHACFSIGSPKVRFTQFVSGLIFVQCPRWMLSIAIGRNRVCRFPQRPSKSHGGSTSSSRKNETEILYDNYITQIQRSKIEARHTEHRRI